MPPSQFYLRLQHGITGGFAPPTPSEVHTITASEDNPTALAISSALRPHGTPDLLSETPTSLPRANADHLVDELHAILTQIPVESPPGSQDIYAMDTSIAWGSPDLEWVNGGPQGCSGGISNVQPTEEHKVMFRRAVDIVKELIKLEPST